MKMSIARKFYLALVLPLVLISLVVTAMTYGDLESNANDITAALSRQVKAHDALFELQTRPNVPRDEAAEIQAESLDANAHVASETKRVHRHNLLALLQIASILLLGIGIVSGAISYLTRQIERSEGNTRSLLGALNEGLFFFDAKGQIPPERSQALGRIIPGSECIGHLKEFVKAYSDVPIANVDICLDLLWNNDPSDFMSDFDSTVTFLPQLLKLPGGRTIKLEYRAVNGGNGKLERVVVVVADISERLRSEREATLQAERVRKISKVASSQESYFGFLEEAIRLFRSADALMGLSRQEAAQFTQLKRDIHTLKGSVATFEFNSLAAEFHALESLMEEAGAVGEAAKAKWETIKDQWKFETTDIEQALALGSSRGKVKIAGNRFQALLAHAKRTKDKALQEILEESLRSPFSEVFSKYASYLSKLSERTAEKKVRIAFAADSSDVSFTEMQKLDSSLIHIFRNCFDHGIEEQDERERGGKPSEGTVQCAVYRKTDGWIHLIIKDDGRGIDGDRLAEKAVAKGIWDKSKAAAASYQEKAELIFAPDLSTKDAVTDLSGRGVGMDAVRSALATLGGTISVYSQPGRGTQFEIDVPPSPAFEELKGSELVAI